MKHGKFDERGRKRELQQADGSAEAVQASRNPETGSDLEQNTDARQNVLMYLHDLVFLLGGILIVFLLCFRIVVVSGTSMNDTLLDGDYLLLLSNVFYREPQAGDIIVASKNSFEDGEPIVKRVIATEGQVVAIDFEEGIVYVDGVALEESYIKNLTTTYEGVDFPITIDEGCVFVLGDNRGISRDSRYPAIGQIDRREILGKAIFLFLPGTNDGHVERDYGRIGVLNDAR